MSLILPSTFALPLQHYRRHLSRCPHAPRVSLAYPPASPPSWQHTSRLPSTGPPHATARVVPPAYHHHRGRPPARRGPAPAPPGRARPPGGFRPRRAAHPDHVL